MSVDIEVVDGDFERLAAAVEEAAAPIARLDCDTIAALLEYAIPGAASVSVVKELAHHCDAQTKLLTNKSEHFVDASRGTASDFAYCEQHVLSILDVFFQKLTPKGADSASLARLKARLG
ncbi:hypothetical protein [Schaalia suimastitidis]|uniref:hypothetical protein n=1 Tax=Schaalia suimastitidis TaxID=121163 RepID=UPI000410AE29|nr:hypothetical protein [Schaalia suimastitidis]